MHLVTLITSTILVTMLGSVALANHRMTTHRAHVHGEAQMNLVISGKEAMFEFVIPGDSIFGFEHRPRTEEQKKKVRDELSKLIDLGSELVVFPPSLDCEVSARQVLADVMQEEEGKKDKSKSKRTKKHRHSHHHHGEAHGKKDDKKKESPESSHSHSHSHKHSHDHDHDDHHAHEHSDVTAEFRVTCAKDIAKTKLGVRLGHYYKSIERIRAQVLTDRHQFGLTITGESGSIAID